MASIVLSGARNPSYTNNTGQNVRLVLNHLSDVSQVTWAGNTKIIDMGRPISKTRPAEPSSNILNVGLFDGGGGGFKLYIEDGFEYRVVNTGTVVSLIYPGSPKTPFTAGPVINYSAKPLGAVGNINYDFATEVAIYGSNSSSKINSIPRTIFLSPGQSFSAICRAYNIVVIKEDGN